MTAEVLDGNFGLGFVGGRPAQAGLRVHAIADDEVVLAVHASHRFSGRDEVSLQDLAGERFIVREGSSESFRTVLETLSEHHLVQRGCASKRLALSFLSASKGLALRSDGAALASQGLLRVAAPHPRFEGR